MKKVFGLLMFIFVLIVLVSCNNKETIPQESTSNNTTTPTNTTSSPITTTSDTTTTTSTTTSTENQKKTILNRSFELAENIESLPTVEEINKTRDEETIKLTSDEETDVIDLSQKPDDYGQDYYSCYVFQYESIDSYIQSYKLMKDDVLERVRELNKWISYDLFENSTIHRDIRLSYNRDMDIVYIEERIYSDDESNKQYSKITSTYNNQNKIIIKATTISYNSVNNYFSSSSLEYEEDNLWTYIDIYRDGYYQHNNRYHKSIVQADLKSKDKKYTILEQSSTGQNLIDKNLILMFNENNHYYITKYEETDNAILKRTYDVYDDYGGLVAKKDHNVYHDGKSIFDYEISLYSLDGWDECYLKTEYDDHGFPHDYVHVIIESKNLDISGKSTKLNDFTKTTVRTGMAQRYSNAAKKPVLIIQSYDKDHTVEDVLTYLGLSLKDLDLDIDDYDDKIANWSAFDTDYICGKTDEEYVYLYQKKAAEFGLITNESEVSPIFDVVFSETAIQIDEQKEVSELYELIGTDISGEIIIDDDGTIDLSNIKANIKKSSLLDVGSKYSLNIILKCDNNYIFIDSKDATYENNDFVIDGFNTDYYAPDNLSQNVEYSFIAYVEKNDVHMRISDLEKLKASDENKEISFVINKKEILYNDGTYETGIYDSSKGLKISIVNKEITVEYVDLNFKIDLPTINIKDNLELKDKHIISAKEYFELDKNLLAKNVTYVVKFYATSSSKATNSKILLGESNDIFYDGTEFVIDYDLDLASDKYDTNYSYNINYEIYVVEEGEGKRFMHLLGKNNVTVENLAPTDIEFEFETLILSGDLSKSNKKLIIKAEYFDK